MKNPYKALSERFDESADFGPLVLLVLLVVFSLVAGVVVLGALEAWLGVWASITAVVVLFVVAYRKVMKP